MTANTILFQKGLSLQTLSDQIATEEARLGPLQALGRTVDKTAATYELGMAPDNPVRLILDAGAVPEGAAQVCKGQVWIINQNQRVIAVRDT